MRFVSSVSGLFIELQAHVLRFGEKVHSVLAALASHAGEIGDTPPMALPGLVLDDCLTIACGDGALRCLRVQRQGKAAMDTDAFLRGFEIVPGTQLDLP